MKYFIWTILIFISISTILIYIGELFRKIPVVFFVLWFCIPIVSLFLKNRKTFFSISEKPLGKIKTILIILSIAFSFIIFAHDDYIRDKVGYNYIEGYDVEYYTDYDEYGRPHAAANYKTDLWFDKIALWAFQMLFFILIIGIPAITWRLCYNNYNKNILRK